MVEAVISAVKDDRGSQMSRVVVVKLTLVSFQYSSDNKQHTVSVSTPIHLTSLNVWTRDASARKIYVRPGLKLVYYH